MNLEGTGGIETRIIRRGIMVIGGTCSVVAIRDIESIIIHDSGNKEF